MVVYVAQSTDSHALKALQELETLGAHVGVVVPEANVLTLGILPVTETDKMVALFSATGQFPSRYFRHVKDLERDKMRGIAVPEWARPCGRYVAINSARDLSKLSANFRLGIEQLHERFSEWRKPRTRRTGGGYQRSRRSPYMPL